jgi:hypothetical protein
MNPNRADRDCFVASAPRNEGTGHQYLVASHSKKAKQPRWRSVASKNTSDSTGTEDCFVEAAPRKDIP